MISRLRIFFINNAVAILILLLIAVALPVAKLPAKFLAQEILLRLGRDTFLVLALLLPIMAGMGLNFGMVLGAMAGRMLKENLKSHEEKIKKGLATPTQGDR